MFKKIVITLAIVLSAACASSQKSADSKATTPKTESTSAPATTETKQKSKKAEASPAAGVVECTNKDDKRTIEIKTTDKGCEVMYTKQGNTSNVASGSQKKCDSVVDKIKTNLTNAGFTCS